MVWRVTKKKAKNEIISLRIIKEERSNEWNMPFFENQTIIIELWYIPRKLINNILPRKLKKLFKVSEQEFKIKRLGTEPKQD